MKRKMLVIAFVVSLVFLFANGMVFAKTLKLGTIFPENQPDSKGAVLFKKLVEEQSIGGTQRDVRPNAARGFGNGLLWNQHAGLDQGWGAF